ncbi:DNA repair protein RadC [Exiguobacterium sp. SH0S1]|nr:DNA repair protein RadC [Exiguobacterium sp. SH0S1]
MHARCEAGEKAEVTSKPYLSLSSGDATPSREDIEVSERLVEAGNIVGIACLDHVIIGEDHYVSMKQRGYMNG